MNRRIVLYRMVNVLTKQSSVSVSDSQKDQTKAVDSQRAIERTVNDSITLLGLNSAYVLHNNAEQTLACSVDIGVGWFNTHRTNDWFNPSPRIFSASVLVFISYNP
jgi:hypothetical protein